MPLLHGFGVLRVLELGDNSIRKIEHLESLGSTLEQLYLGKNKITRLENLALSNLQILSVQSNRLTRLENLNQMPKLREL